MCAIEPVLI